MKLVAADLVLGPGPVVVRGHLNMELGKKGRCFREPRGYLMLYSAVSRGRGVVFVGTRSLMPGIHVRVFVGCIFAKPG